MGKYKNMTPENMYWYDRTFGQSSAQSSRLNSSTEQEPIRTKDIEQRHVVFTVYDELNAMQVIHRSFSRLAKKPLAMTTAMQQYEKERQFIQDRKEKK